MLLLALVALGSIFFCASLKLILNSQKVIAIQARLDICTVRYATSREKFFREMKQTNFIVHTSMIATSIARGLMIVPLVGEAAAVGNVMGKFTNRAAGLWQLEQIGVQQAKDIHHSACEKSPFSEEKIFCVASDPVIAGALKRDKAFFRDLFDSYRYRRKKLGSVTCFLAAKPSFRTKLEFTGDTKLDLNNYADFYAH